MLPKSYKEPGYRICASCKYSVADRDQDGEGWIICLKYAPSQDLNAYPRQPDEAIKYHLYLDDLGRAGFSINNYGTCDEWER